MDMTAMREIIAQVQQGAHVTTAVGQPITVGDRVVIPVAEVAYGGGGGGGREKEEEGGGGGGGMRVRPLGCWVVDDAGERWVPAFDLNKAIMIAGVVAVSLLCVVRAFARRR